MNEVLLDIAKTEFGPELVAELKTRTAVNRDGETAYWVDVIYYGGNDALSLDAMQRFVDRVWMALKDEDVTPVVSFISNEEFSLEAAE